MKILPTFFALLLGATTAAWAQTKGPAAGKDLMAKDPLADAQQAQSQYADKPLPEMKGVCRGKRWAK